MRLLATSAACWASLALVSVFAPNASVAATSDSPDIQQRHMHLPTDDHGPQTLRALNNKKKRKKQKKKARTNKNKKSKPKSKPKPKPPPSPPKRQTVYETVDFTILQKFNRGAELCGTREEVSSGIESAFESFFTEESEECGSDVEVQTVTLALYVPSPLCCMKGTVWLEKYDACVHDCETEGCEDPCTEHAIKNGEFYHVYCRDGKKYVQCDEFGGCFVMPCGPCTKWSQEAYTCVPDDDDTSEECSGRRELANVAAVTAVDVFKDSADRQLQNTQSTRGRLNRRAVRSRRRLELGDRVLNKNMASKAKSKSKSKCSADLTDSLNSVFPDDNIIKARITRIKEADCSKDSKDCTSTKEGRGACCGVCKCACVTPSESLCEEEDFCVEQARPFDADFCEDFIPKSKASSKCKPKHCERH